MSAHFEKERSGVGLHGLYTKYKDYAEPLAKLFLVFGRVIITLQIKEDQGTHADARKNFKIIAQNVSKKKYNYL